MVNRATEFWLNGDEEHQQIAQTFERGIEVQHPDWVTSRRMCPCLEYSYRCPFPLEGKVEYIEYNGPSIR